MNMESCLEFIRGCDSKTYIKHIKDISRFVINHEIVQQAIVENANLNKIFIQVICTPNTKTEGLFISTFISRNPEIRKRYKLVFSNITKKYDYLEFRMIADLMTEEERKMYIKEAPVKNANDELLSFMISADIYAYSVWNKTSLIEPEVDDIHMYKLFKLENRRVVNATEEDYLFGMLNIDDQTNAIIAAKLGRFNF